MREIKFRGKRVDNGKWCFGFYFLNKYGEIFILDTEGYLEWDVEPKTLGQYTGLKDKNGVEIYEGDKLNCLDSYGEDYYETTVLSDGAFSVDVVGCDYDYTSLIYAYGEGDDIVECVVIGNVHDYA